jgi:hypothetical protein
VTSADGLAARILAGECGQCLDGVDQASEASGGGECGCGNGLLADGDEAGRDLVAVERSHLSRTLISVTLI